MQNKDLITIIETFSNERGVPREDVTEAIEASIAVATRKTYEEAVDIRVIIDPVTGDYQAYKQWLVMADDDPEFETPDTQILHSRALTTHPDIEVGEYIREEVEPVDFGRISAQTARQVLTQKIREKERAMIVEDYTPRIGELMTPVVKRNEKNGLILDFGEYLEGIVLRTDLLFNDSYRVGERIRAVLKDVSDSPRGPQLILTRTSSKMLEELFRIEVPEIHDDLIDIVSISRDPGFRAKVAVRSNDKRLDPVGTCIGMRGSRVMAISNELGNERVDIVVWDENPAQYVINAMSPAQIKHISLDEDKKVMDIGVDEEMLAQAIGKSGQNVQLASNLTGWELNVMSLSEMSDKQSSETGKVAEHFIEKLNVSKEIGTLLAQGGYTSIEEIAYIPANEMLEIEGFDEAIVAELKQNAKNELLMGMLATENTPDETLLNLEGMTPELAQELSNQKICTQEDLADLSIDELQELITIDKDTAWSLILKAREPWFE